MRLSIQPTQSLDLNMLDLGFFHSLQHRAVEFKEGASIADFVTAVESAFHRDDAPALERVWRSLLKAVFCMVDYAGGNDYRVPHVGAGDADAGSQDAQGAPINR